MNLYDRHGAAGVHLFHEQEADYLELVITPKGLKMQDGKVATVRNWVARRTPPTCDSEIYDKELLTAVRFEKWRTHLVGLTQPIRVLTDYKTLNTYKKAAKLEKSSLVRLYSIVQFPAVGGEWVKMLVRNGKGRNEAQGSRGCGVLASGRSGTS